MLRVFVVAESPLPRAGLRAVLDRMDDAVVVGDAPSPDGLANAESDDPIDVIVADLGLDASVDELEELSDLARSAAVLVLGPILDDDRLATLLSHRAWGYVSRDVDAERLQQAVRSVGGGLLALDPALAAGLFAPPSDEVRPELPNGPDGQPDELTAREREVLGLVALGLPNKTIARELQISEHTVKFHVAAILAKLGAGSRTEAAHIGARRGLVTL